MFTLGVVALPVNHTRIIISLALITSRNRFSFCQIFQIWLSPTQQDSVCLNSNLFGQADFCLAKFDVRYPFGIIGLVHFDELNYIFVFEEGRQDKRVV
jgi:hypothetical protein